MSTSLKHKGDYLCLHCQSCFTDLEDGHVCEDFIEVHNIGYFTSAGEWFWRHETSSKGSLSQFIETEMRAWSALLKYIYESPDCFSSIARPNRLTKEEREALLPENRVPHALARKP